MERGGLNQAILVFAVVFPAFAVGAILAWTAFGAESGPAFFYPAAGVTVAVMMLTPRSCWPAVFAAIVLGESLVDVYFGSPVTVAAAYSLANVIEPALGASLVLAWCGGPPDLRIRRHLVLFLAGACVAGPVVGGLVGGTATVAHFGGFLPFEMLQWWAGDALGVLVTATPILLWIRQSAVIRRRPVETAAVVVLTAVLMVTASWSSVPPSMLVLPILAWAALRLDMLGAALAGAAMAFSATLLYSQGRSLFATLGISTENRLIVTQLFVGVVIIVTLLIAQEASAHSRAVRDREIERRERLRLRGLSELAQQLSAAVTPQDVGQAIEEHVLNEAGATAVTLGLVNSDGTQLDWVVMRGFPPPVFAEFGGGISLDRPSVATDAVRTGQPVIIGTPDEYAAKYPDTLRLLQYTGAQCLVGWPLGGGGKPFGSLVLTWATPQPLNVAQLSYVSAVATMVSQALVRARIYADEHARALVLQSAVMPTSTADAPGMDISTSYEPADAAQGLGGDWFDVMLLPDGGMYFAVGDVIGHGLSSVEDMAQLRSAGRALAHQGLSPGQVLAELNGFTRHASTGKFATMGVAVFTPQTQSLRYSFAGHPPALLRRAGDGSVQRLDDSGGPVLGPLSDASYTESTVGIHSGDILVMYTDGLVERRGRDIERGIGQAMRIIAGWDESVTLSAVCTSLRETLAPRPRNDDVCLIAVRFSDAAAVHTGLDPQPRPEVNSSQ